MSRFADDWGWDGDGLSPAMWEAVVRRATYSPRGQKVMRELEAALLALPQKRLVEGVICEQGECCAVGALALYRVQQGGLLLKQGKARRTIRTQEELEEEVRGYCDEWETQDFGTQMGLASSLAWKIAWLNDERCEGITPESRYETMLGLIRGMIRPENPTGHP